MALSALFSGWSLETRGDSIVQMNDYPRQNPAYRLTYFFSNLLKNKGKAFIYTLTRLSATKNATKISNAAWQHILFQVDCSI
jgi:hypothetical protein